MSELHKKNHFVPECYLKRWQDSKNKICVYRTLVNHQNVPLWKKYSVSAIAYHNNLYTQMVAGAESDRLERWLDKEFESPANAVLEKAVLEKRLSPDDWNILIRFLAAQDVRTPSRLLEHLKYYNEKYPEILESTLKDLTKNIEGNTLERSDIKHTSKKHSSLIPMKVTTELIPGENGGIIKAESYAGRSTWFFSINHLLENTEKVLHKHKWSIVKPAKGYSWPTSDNPVIKLNFINHMKYNLKGGWDKEKGNIIFPIGPDHAMFVQISDRPIPKWTRLTVDQTRIFRKIIVENAHRMVFSNFFDAEIPIIRERIVDGNQLKNEQKEIEQWHQKNSELELEYFKNP